MRFPRRAVFGIKLKHKWLKKFENNYNKNFDYTFGLPHQWGNCVFYADACEQYSRTAEN